MTFRRTPVERHGDRKSGTNRRFLTASITGAQTTGAGKATFDPLPEGGRYIGCFVTLGTVNEGATFIVDVHKNGTTLYTTQASRPTIADTADPAESTEAAAADVTALAKGDVLTIDIDQIGSGVAGEDLKIFVTYEV